MAHDPTSAVAVAPAAQSPGQTKDERSVAEARDLIERAYKAFLEFQTFTQEQVDRIVDAVAAAATANAEKLARIAVEETTYGVVEHKVIKNLFSSQRVYEAIRPLKTVGVVREDKAQGIIEVAVPAGVVAAILPSTNPTSTAIYKILIAIKGRNAIVLSPHPTALRCSCEAAAIMKDAAVKAGAPADVICCFNTPSLPGTQELMKHRRTSVILATGGMAMVRAAYSSGKPAFGVGPGNVPAMIDSSADLPKAVADVVFGKTFDNGTICSSEQAIVAEESVRGPILKELAKNGAHMLSRDEIQKLGKQMVNTETHTICPKFVGKSAVKVAELAGLQVPAGVRVLVAPLDKVGRDEPLSAEKLSPVLALYFEKDRAAAMARCAELLRFGGLGHTCAIHAKDDAVIREYGMKMPAYRVVVNSPAPQGSIGSSTNLFPAMTLGCGAAGGNITSDNISPLHLINLRRIAYEARPVTSVVGGQWPVASAAPPASTATTCGVCATPAETAAPAAGTGVNWSVARAVDRFLAGKQVAPPAAKPAAIPTQAAPAKTDAPPSAAPPPKPRAVDFVSEAEIRAAVKRKAKIFVGPKTIITPAARDLAAEYDVLVRVD
ncbi:MAG: aldehyde dehydrogenase family protein [Acidobacteriia bacterium]|nr:aldehyde dehydrogenase family protein [Terriglobia bacterium]